MRLNLYWRGRDIIDIELHVWRLRDDDPQPGPVLEAAAGGEFERADPMEAPDTTVRIGFRSHP